MTRRESPRERWLHARTTEPTAPLRVVTISKGGQPVKAAVCPCGEPCTQLPGRCRYCKRSIKPSDVAPEMWTETTESAA